MKFQQRTVVIMGLMVCAGLIASSNAVAYGPQWRPAMGPENPMAPPAAHMPPPVSGGPVFRPIAPPRGPYDAPPVRGYGPAFQHPAYPPAYGYRQQAPMGGPAHGWNRPMPDMQPQSAYEPPAFTRQYAWRPAPQPWIAQRDRYQQHRSPAYGYAVPPVADYRQPWSAPGFAPSFMPGGFMNPPMVAGAGGYPFPPLPAPGYAADMGGYPAAWMPTFAWMPPPAPIGQGWFGPQIVAGYPSPMQPMWPAPPAYGQPFAPQPHPWMGTMAFRPPTYDADRRRQDVTERRQAADAQFTRENLPGWVTTYQENGQLDYCEWCGGS